MCPRAPPAQGDLEASDNNLPASGLPCPLPWVRGRGGSRFGQFSWEKQTRVSLHLPQSAVSFAGTGWESRPSWLIAVLCQQLGGGSGPGVNNSLGGERSQGIEKRLSGVRKPGQSFLPKSSVLGSGTSELPLIQQLPEPVTDLAQVLSEVRPVEGCQQVRVRVVVKHVPDAVM